VVALAAQLPLSTQHFAQKLASFSVNMTRGKGLNLALDFDWLGAIRTRRSNLPTFGDFS
jgi:hypothetical protein